MDTENMSLKEKCYAYQQEVNYFLDSEKYILAHIDGRSFSKMIKNKFKKPFDDVFINAMNETAIYLCKSVQGCIFAYTQSDEISLIIRKNDPEGDVFFDGRMCKMQSIIASLATSRFTQVMMENLLKTVPTCASSENVLDMCIDAVKNSPLYQFDCKVWNVNSANDTMAWILFRNIDCVRNSKQQTAQTYLPHKKLMSLNTDEQISLLKQEKNIDWNDFDDGKKYGRFIKKTEKVFAMNEADKYENASYTRHVWEAVNGCDLTIPSNRDILINELNLKDNE
jgi:tRNA(His) 5'-end guanylyltransferase